MKLLLLGFAAAMAVFVGNADAADGSKLIAACKANVDNKSVPSGVTGDAYMKFCQCLVTKAGNNQSVIDEHVAIATATGADMQTKIAASSAAAKANAAACQTETGMTPPPAQ
jgi:hypothetical protein